MNDEKQMILEMLKDGKITVEQANDLLDAIGGKKIRNERDFISKLSQSIDSVIKKTSETIGNFDFDSIDINQFNIRGDINTHKEMRIEDEINTINIDIPSGKVFIDRAIDSAITLTQDIWSKKDNLIDYLDVEISEDSLNIHLNESYKNLDASAVIKLELGKNLYDALNINLVNGVIEIEDVDFSSSDIDTVNTKVNIINSQGNLDIDNVNGKVDLKNTNGYLNVENVNGTIYLSNISGDGANIKSTSGSIRVDGLHSSTFKAENSSGNIRIYNIKDVEEINLNSGSGNIVIDADGFDENIKANVVSKDLVFSDKYKNKVEKNQGYEISTSIDEAKLNIEVLAPFGKVSLR